MLILDDYHVIDEPSIHTSLQFLLDHAPTRLHLVLSSRVDPPLALSRLRARGQMAEFRDTDLRVNEQEGARFLQQVMDVHLSTQDEQRLAPRTESWLVGLQLAALSLAIRADPGAWVATFSGSQRFLLDYFQEEILAHQKPSVRRFLLRACILPRMHASLCQAVTGNAASQEVLEALERTNLFVSHLEEQRQWYRLHDLFREAQNFMFATNLLTRGIEQLLAGHVEAAWQNFLESLRLAERLGSLTATLSASLLLAEVCLARGQLHQAARYCRQALASADENPEAFQQQLMTASGDRDPFFLSWAYHSLARLACEWNDLDTAQHALTQAQALGDDPAKGVHVWTSGGLIRARLLHHRGKTTAALHLLEAWEQQTRFPWKLRALRAEEARLHLAMGNLPAVEEWSRARADFFGLRVHEHERELPYAQQEEEALLLVRLSLAQGHPRTALQELARWKAQAESQGRTHALLEILILEALAHQADRAFPQARASLLQALRLAQPEQYQRLFLDEGQVMAALLKSSLKEIQEPTQVAYARGLLDAIAQEQTNAPALASPGLSPLLEPLTAQEQHVLQLLAEGASNQEIAKQLVIQLSTARKHVSNILGKLEAANRTQAIARAREYGLL